MTDTPRTQEELLAIFATNGEGAINAQNMRDFVVSVGNPAAGGLGAILDKQQAFSIYAVNQSISVPNNGFPNIPVDPALYSGALDVDVFLFDPQGFHTVAADDPEPYGGLLGGYYLQGIPQNSVWVSQATVQWAAGTFDASDAVFLSTGYPRPNYAFPDDASQDTASGLFGFPTYAYGANAVHNFGDLGAARAIYSGLFTIPFYADDRFDLWNMSTPLAQQISGDTQTITAVEFDVWRII